MRLSELIESINGVPVYAAKRRSGEKKAAETEITGISDDSRYIGRGEAFFALGGGSADGRDFAAEAATQGKPLRSPRARFTAIPQKKCAWQG